MHDLIASRDRKRMDGTDSVRSVDTLVGARTSTRRGSAPPSGTTYPKLVQFDLIRYEGDETLAYTYQNISTYMQLSKQDEIEYGKKLWKLAQSFGGVVRENVI